ncbi:hypothetical protein BSKO_01803 [Bryopsis sp. KO-2023]|nr:hypothetical protein BSKO_01803 [Bryopsis sp. KO-2023]
MWKMFRMGKGRRLDTRTSGRTDGLLALKCAKEEKPWFGTVEEGRHHGLRLGEFVFSPQALVLARVKRASTVRFDGVLFSFVQFGPNLDCSSYKSKEKVDCEDLSLPCIDLVTPKRMLLPCHSRTNETSKRVSNALWMTSLWRNRRRPSGTGADIERCARRRRVETVNDGEELQKEKKFRTAVATSGIWWKGEEGDPQQMHQRHQFSSGLLNV